jgi:hypothetical protein
MTTARMETIVGLKGHFTLSVQRPDRTDVYEFDNLITNAGMDSIGNITYASGGNLGACLVGSGSAAPANTDTAIKSFIAGQGATGTTSAVTTDHGSLTKTYKFAQGAVVGNLAEVGISDKGDNTGMLFSRALILDGGGSPTTITVTTIDILTVTYELDLYWPTSDATVTLADGATTYTVTCRAAETVSGGYWAQFISNVFGGSNNAFWSISAYTGAIGSITGVPSTPIGVSSVYTRGAYTSGSYSRTDTVLIDINTWNGNLTAFEWTSPIGAYQFGFSPAIAKDNTKTLALARTISWARR